MTQPQLNRRLSALDAVFLNFERKEAPLHIGSVHIFESDIPFEDFIAHMVAKLPLLPRYTQKVVPAPLNLGHPTWEVDTKFDIRKHVYRLQLESPGTDEQFHALAEKVMMPMLDRDKPLWEIHLVYGLSGGRCGMFSKVHHAMIDGMSGIDLLKIILDISPEVKPLPKIETPPPPPAPNPTEALVESLLASTEEGFKSWFEFQKSALNLAQTFMREPSPKALQDAFSISPVLTSLASPLSFNKPPSGKQKLIWAEYFFSETRAIRGALGGTVNDVILTALSGAIARYVESRGQPVRGRMLRIMVPVSMRQENQRGALGNLVSVLPVEIPMDLTDPVERLHYVVSKTGSLKSAKVADSLNLFTTLLGAVPPSIQAIVGSMAYIPVPAFNIVCTNVPGPQIPLYSLGKRMLIYYPYVPVAYSVGLACAILSYDQKVYFGITVDGEHEPNPYILKNYLDDAFAELRRAAGIEQVKSKTVQESSAEKRTKRASSANGSPKEAAVAATGTKPARTSAASEAKEAKNPAESAT